MSFCGLGVDFGAGFGVGGFLREFGTNFVVDIGFATFGGGNTANNPVDF